MNAAAKSELPDAQGHFGPCGGRFVPETLMHPLQELEVEYFRAQHGPEFHRELDGTEIYLKREDLMHMGAHKINNAIGTILPTKRIAGGKMRNFMFICAIVLGLGLSSASAFQIITSSYNSNGIFELQFPTSTDSYYALYRGTNVSDINTLISVVSGTGSVGHLFDTDSESACAFYRVREINNSESRVLTSLAPASSTIPPAGTVHLTVSLDIPAPPGGTTVALSVDPSGAGTIPATLTVPAGMTSASFDYVDGEIEVSATVTATLGASTLSSTITVAHLVINEIDYDNVGTDAAEFIEVYNLSTNSVNLTNLALIFINGANNTEYLRVYLSGSLSAHGYLVVASSNVVVAAGATVVYFTNAANNIQNGAPDGVALFDVASQTLIDSLSYEGSITLGNINGAGTFNLVEGTVLSSSVSDSNTTAGSLIRSPNGQDTDNADSDWKFTTTPTPGAVNILDP